MVQVSDEAEGDNRDLEDTATPGSAAEPKLDIGWPQAGLVGLGVFGYFVILTVWLPSRLLRIGAVASSQQWIQDVTVVGSWAVALSAGLVALRVAQERGRI